MGQGWVWYECRAKSKRRKANAYSLGRRHDRGSKILDLHDEDAIDAPGQFGEEEFDTTSVKVSGAD